MNQADMNQAEMNQADRNNLEHGAGNPDDGMPSKDRPGSNLSGAVGSTEREPGAEDRAVPRILIQAGALQAVAPYLEQRGIRQAVIAADAATYEAAGERLARRLEAAGVAVQATRIRPNAQGDVIADEVALMQLLVDLKRSGAPAVISVGGGTLHDIARFCAYAAGAAFLSVPTAPSVDGFNSLGAPVILRGEKITIPAVGPDAVFADLDVLTRAPARLAAAGFGDMLGKFTSLFDWRFGAEIADEPYLAEAADRTRLALETCVANVDRIAARTEEGIHSLIGALIESGLAMLLFGRSHPASGSEHHLSHYWEMEYIRLGKRQLLHGAKVGVASIEISRLYHRLADLGPDKWLPAARTDGDAMAARMADRIAGRWSALERELRRIPQPEALAELLARAGGPTTPEELAIEPELLRRSLREAHRVRAERFTLLRAYNELGAFPAPSR